MDGDSPDLLKLVELCEQFSAQVFIDEAHAIGVFGTGIIDDLELGNRVSRLVTFGKAMGCHGAAILGSENLKSYPPEISGISVNRKLIFFGKNSKIKKCVLILERSERQRSK